MTEMSSDLTRLQIPFERLPGVPGAAVRRTDSVCGALCTNGMLGCFESHLRAWRLVKDRKLQMALILEDDVRLQPCAAKFGWDGCLKRARAERYMPYLNPYLPFDKGWNSW